MSQAIKLLEQYALDNYEAGGHWVYECFGAEDYDQYLTEANGNLSAAMAALKDYWELVCDRERDCAWDGQPDEAQEWADFDADC
jgi:hypothetical protein